ncbi:low-density lipoprotein receptor-related protein 8-like isoform X2 [Ornithodoros turicata]|uniref:low-density lipoprotein receptor-related protein 8-like isoform X2 n=1 Tax=Ornithodoros turicata TaxID=34597 RepID=UPI0031398590
MKPTVTPPFDDFNCNNTSCITDDLICDYHDDCGDGSDAKRCGNCPCDDIKCNGSNSFLKGRVCIEDLDHSVKITTNRHFRTSTKSPGPSLSDPFRTSSVGTSAPSVSFVSAQDAQRKSTPDTAVPAATVFAVGWATS